MGYDMETIEGRTKYLINQRKKDIKKFEAILRGECLEYSRYMKDETFLGSVRLKLKSEKELLLDLEGFSDVLSEKLVGSTTLMASNHSIVSAEGDSVIISVKGETSENIADEWDKVYQEENNKLKIFRSPMTIEEIKSIRDENNYVEGIVIVDLDDIIGYDLESFLDIISDKLIGSVCLMDTNYTVFGTEGESILIRVKGDASNAIEEDEEE